MASTLHKPDPGETEGSHHLCVLVHGLWGNGSHLNYLTNSLREKYSEDELILLVCKRNASSFTYDGIEVGAERVTREIEDTIEELKRDGTQVDRFSIIGYSMGGLIARYAIGLLDSKHYFDHMKLKNFCTFATPHLGARTPRMGYSNQIWNVLGARTLSASGRQLFTVDNFRDTGRPLLSVLADPESIFIRALAKFENRSLYTNIINDRTAVYYTTAISKIDPFTDLERIKLNYIEGYEDIILDPNMPYQLAEPKELPVFSERLRQTSGNLISKIPRVLGLTLLVPIAVIVFLTASGIQTFRSARRIALHEQDESEEGFAKYRTSWMVQNVRAGIEDVFEATNAAHPQEYLPEGSEELADGESDIEDRPGNILEKAPSNTLRRTSTSRSQTPDFPTLALTPAQFSMIKALDDVGFTKYRVHIHKSSHSHAALIVRSNRAAFSDGKVVVKHWLDTNFLI